ncbi:MAG: hypothetical protein HYX61_13520 [Gammaproteobacteria bacterium]|jgi:hypothetical protein|nr:hypothetical protein [Gammaproteobacteria bacterium]
MKANNFTLSLLSLAFGSFASTTYAAVTTHPADPFLVSIPHFSTTYEINASLLWQQPTSTSNAYAILTHPMPVPTPNWIINSANPQYHFGFDVGLSYAFNNTGNDVQLNWTRLKTNDSTSVSIDDNGLLQFVGPFFQIGPTAGGAGGFAPMIASAARNHFDYDVVNLDAGQYVNFGHRLQTRLFGGVSYLRIKQDLQTTFFAPADVNFSFVSNNISEFTGFGPRFGFGGTYDLCYGFGIVGQVAATASVGRIRATDHFTETSTALLGAAPSIPLNVQAITTHHETRVVPGADAKLGISFAYDVNKNSLLTAELGYKVAAYENAIRKVYPNSLVNPPNALQTGTIAVETMGESQSDFGVNGPYFNLSYSF